MLLWFIYWCCLLIGPALSHSPVLGLLFLTNKSVVDKACPHLFSLSSPLDSTHHSTWVAFQTAENTLQKTLWNSAHIVSTHKLDTIAQWSVTFLLHLSGFVFYSALLSRVSLLCSPLAGIQAFGWTSWVCTSCLLLLLDTLPLDLGGKCTLLWLFANRQLVSAEVISRYVYNCIFRLPLTSYFLWQLHIFAWFTNIVIRRNHPIYHWV